MKKLTLLFALAAVALSAAPPPRVRLDVDGTAEKIDFQNVSLGAGLVRGQTPWVKEDARSSYLAVQTEDPLTSKWQTYEFNFIPRRSGTVRLMLRGTSTQKNGVLWIDYDRLEVYGAKCVNPSFEILEDGVFAGWTMRELNVRKDQINAADGKNFIRCSHDFFAEQRIALKAGVRVTVRFRTRSAGFSSRRR